MTTKDAKDTCSSNSYETKARKCRSQPFMMPTFKLTERLMKHIKLHGKFLQSKSVDSIAPVDFTLDESKVILKEIAQGLDRILQMRDLSLLTKVSEDGSSEEWERQTFLLQWAEELQPQADEEKLSRQTGVSSPCDNRPDENSEEWYEPKHEDDKTLKHAIDVLKTWTGTLREDSVCLDMDVVEVVKDMTQQWKRGKLPNILPVMDFIIWTLLHWNGQKGSIGKHWNRNEEPFKSRAVTQHIPESAWKWITKGTVKVRLDKSTANPCLKISEDRRAVKMDQIVESVNNPFEDFRRTHHQFDGWWCVLGSKGFVSGSHYWEVDVSGKTEWRIGVVRESAYRNGFKGLDTTTGYWTLILKLGQLMAMTCPVTKLDKCAPNVLGVSLDMEGQVSFYDVRHRFHIYSFNVSFDREEKIFPVFGTIETKREMRIVK